VVDSYCITERDRSSTHMNLFGLVDAMVNDLVTATTIVQVVPMDPLSTVRTEIKSWERSFKSKHGRDPTIQDIKSVSSIGLSSSAVNPSISSHLSIQPTSTDSTRSFQSLLDPLLHLHLLKPPLAHHPLHQEDGHRHASLTFYSQIRAA
jgi:hypothetical protein